MSHVNSSPVSFQVFSKVVTEVKPGTENLSTRLDRECRVQTQTAEKHPYTDKC